MYTVGYTNVYIIILWRDSKYLSNCPRCLRFLVTFPVTGHVQFCLSKLVTPVCHACIPWSLCLPTRYYKLCCKILAKQNDFWHILNTLFIVKFSLSASQVPWPDQSSADQSHATICYRVVWVAKPTFSVRYRAQFPVHFPAVSLKLQETVQEIAPCTVPPWYSKFIFSSSLKVAKRCVALLQANFLAWKHLICWVHKLYKNSSLIQVTAW